MKKIVLFSLFFVLSFLTQVSSLMAQCAMCRATVENNVSNGETSVAAGLNLGIIYLFTMPYLIVAIIGVLWYRYSKKKKVKIAIR